MQRGSQRLGPPWTAYSGDGPPWHRNDKWFASTGLWRRCCLVSISSVCSPAGEQFVIPARAFSPPLCPEAPGGKTPYARAGLAQLCRGWAPPVCHPSTISQETPGKAPSTWNLLVEEQLAEGCCLQSSSGPCLQHAVHRDPMMAQTQVG